MRGIIFPGNGAIDVLEIPDPTPAPDEVVVAVGASGMCGTDLNLIKLAPGAKRHPKMPAPDGPIIAGHEPAGTIAAVGSSVRSAQARVGDRVMVHHYSGCGVCSACRTGWSQMCLNQAPTVYGITAHGGHAQYLKVPAHTVVPLPEELSFVAGAGISCGIGTAYGALRRVRPSGNDTIAVFGQGPVGLAATQLAAAMGAHVIALDVTAARLARATELGAEAVVNPADADPVEAITDLTRGRGVAYAFEASGAESARVQALDVLQPWGTLVLIAGVTGLHVDNVSVLISRQLSVIGSWTFPHAGQAECARFIADNKIDVDAIFTDRWELDQAEEAYRVFAGQAGGKGVFVF